MAAGVRQSSDGPLTCDNAAPAAFDAHLSASRRSGLAVQLTRLLGPWRRPAARHAPGKVVLDLAIAVAFSRVRHRPPE
jgi:hypothetical protein